MDFEGCSGLIGFQGFVEVLEVEGLGLRGL